MECASSTSLRQELEPAYTCLDCRCRRQRHLEPSFFAIGSATEFICDMTHWYVTWLIHTIDWCCFYDFLRNSLVALLEALCAWIFFFRLVNIGFFLTCFFLPFCVCARPLSLTKAFLPPLRGMLLCLVVAIPLVCWSYKCACVCVPLYVRMKICR